MPFANTQEDKSKTIKIATVSVKKKTIHLFDIKWMNNFFFKIKNTNEKINTIAT